MFHHLNIYFEFQNVDVYTSAGVGATVICCLSGCGHLGMYQAKTRARSQQSNAHLLLFLQISGFIYAFLYISNIMF